MKKVEEIKADLEKQFEDAEAKAKLLPEDEVTRAKTQALKERLEQESAKFAIKKAELEKVQASLDKLA